LRINSLKEQKREKPRGKHAAFGAAAELAAYSSVFEDGTRLEWTVLTATSLLISFSIYNPQSQICNYYISGADNCPLKRKEASASTASRKTSFKVVDVIGFGTTIERQI
jgi:hypothetical protein